MTRRPASSVFLHMSTTTTSNTFTIPQVTVRRNRQSKSFREGNPLVFGKNILNGKNHDNLKCATLVKVQVPTKSSNTQHHQVTTIGYGVYNPYSMYRIRILSFSLLMNDKLQQALLSATSEDEALQAILLHQLQAAVNVRRAMGLLCRNTNDDTFYTDTFRLVNGEGDGLSGLAVDVIGNQVAVCMSSALWCEIHQNLISKCLQQVLQENDMIKVEVIWKTTPARLEQDGIQQVLLDESGSSSILTKQQQHDNDENQKVVATELGIQYNTFPYAQGQKTGYYCDQRDNRYTLAHYVSSSNDNKKKRVLDLCCYHGGFALNALVHGNALHVTGVDSSQDAIDVCNMNVQLNKHVDADKVTFLKSDISKFMKQAHANGDFYDIIVLDPPKLAPSVSGLDRAKRKYHGLNRDAIKLIDKETGGLLMTCTCSAAMTQKDGGQVFLNMVQQAALAAGRRITLLKKSGAAPCHTQSPASYPAGAYLTAALFYVSPL